ncbi:RmlC-like cupin [Hymenopellis radicata]|nr:RmlC-like cupin [Hymenopellis radicata]
MANKVVLRPTQERGHADHGWLKTFHTFSFASFQDWQHEKFGSLRVINEDRVAPKTGFGTHPHREFEIFSYIVNGELEHKDSMGNVEILKRGDLQMTSAGTGIAHSEKAHGGKEVHFLQIWALPSASRLPPKYFTRHFSDQEKTDTFGVTDERAASGPAPVHSPVTVYATLLSAGKSLAQEMKGTKGYAHVVMTSGYNESASQGATVKVDGQTLREGDGAYIHVEAGKVDVENTGDRTAEVILFDLE